ncbi:MAG: heavy metal-binding domain-containing protein [Flavobacteriaceae bacterium]
MKKLILSIAVVAMIAFTVTSCKSDAKKDAEEVTTEVEKEVTTEVKETKEVEETKESEDMAMVKYQCPMKCEGDKTYDKPGQCPTCKMDLKKMEEHSEEEHSEEEHNH